VAKFTDVLEEEVKKIEDLELDTRVLSTLITDLDCEHRSINMHFDVQPPAKINIRYILFIY
jgi:hypothetical protein